MRKEIVFFFGGIAVTVLAFKVFEEEPGNSSLGTAARPLPIVQTKTPVYPAAGAQDAPDTRQANVDTENFDSAQIGSDEQPSLGELRTRQTETRRAWEKAVDDYRMALSIDKWSSEPPPAVPISLPGEFNYLSESPSDYHELIQREPIDPVWSVATTEQIHTYLADNPELTLEYGYPTVTCRTSRCEVAFVAYGVDDSTRASLQGVTPEFLTGLKFRNENSQVYDTDWATQFGYESTDENPRILIVEPKTLDGVTTILWHLINFGE